MIRALTKPEEEETDLVRIKSKISDFLGEDGGTLSNFLLDGWKTEMQDYISKGKWDTNFVDVLPMILSHMENIDLIVLSFEGQMFKDLVRFNEGGLSKVLIGHFGNHYWRLNIYDSKPKQDKDKYKRITIVLPFINSRLSSNLKRTFEDKKMDCNLVFKSEKIYSLCDSQRLRKDLKLPNEQSGVVYKLACKECKADGKDICYIGETGRKLGVRVREHLYMAKDFTKRTEVCKHGIEVHGDNNKDRWEATILEHEPREFHRLAKEAWWINNEKGCINKMKGLQVFGGINLH
jgi:hypothetical protein